MTRHINDNHELFTDQCCLCERQFTTDNPCWNDDAVALENGKLVHKNGQCKDCSDPLSAAIRKVINRQFAER